MPETNAVREHADLALAQYLKPLARRRRVLVLGEPDSPLVSRLQQQEAEVEILDVAALDPEDLPFEDQSFDMALIPDVQAVPGLAELVPELHRVVHARGVVAMVGQPPAARSRRRRRGPPHAALQQLLAGSFGHVRVLGQTRFDGFAVADLDAEHAELAVDRSMGAPGRPFCYLALGSDRKLRVDEELLVQVPEVNGTRQAAEAPGGSKKLERLRKALAEADQDLEVALNRIEELRSGAKDLQAKAQEAERASKKAQRERDEARARADERHERLDTIRGDVDAAQAEVHDLEQRLAERGQRVGELERELERRAVVARDLLEELGRTQAGEPNTDAAQPASAAEEQLRGRIAGLTLRLEEAEHALAEGGGATEMPPAERGNESERIRQLEAELAEADRVAEAHAAEQDRLTLLEQQLAEARERSDRAEDELRGAESELKVLRETSQAADLEAQARLELAQKREKEARDDRDDARRGLQEARSLLSQLAEKVNADPEDPQTLVDSVAPPSGLRADLEEKQLLLEEMTRQLEERNARIRELEQGAPEHVRTLNEQLGDREAQLVLAQNRLHVAEQQAEAFRQLCLRARDALTAVAAGREADGAEELLAQLGDVSG